MIAGIDGAVLSGDGSVEIEQIEYDSRLIHSPALFFAIKGYQSDGYDFVEEARSLGAVAVVGERKSCNAIDNHIQVPNARKAMSNIAAQFYGNPAARIKVCGVTGTNGKTTTCMLIGHILRARNKTTGVISSLQYDTGDQVFTAERTTPDSLDLQRLFFLMKKNHCVNAVVEVSSHALLLHRVDNINFRVAVYTNLSRDHLDFHGSMEEYLEAKALLLKKLDGPMSYAIINFDVPEFQPLIGQIESAFMTYSLGSDKADVYTSNYEMTRAGTFFDLVTPMGNATVDFKLPGEFNLYNALAAAAAGLGSGVDIDNVVRGLEAGRPLPGRIEPIEAGQPFALFVDFAHTPAAIEQLCKTVRGLTGGKLLLLFGCGGDRDRGKRPLMGKAAVTFADEVVVTTDNPRTEEPLAIIEEIKPGLAGGKFEILPDRRDAIEAILGRAAEGDVVLLAGKGAETFQTVAGEDIPFDEKQVAINCLQQMGYHAKTASEEK